ncbi:Uncharacterised protein [Candidatus Tiddalikarchaeum anstoanum]|nr:Uncharacterised protein [Candidatus Tiddalikarchaeum anstoanum]
MVEAEVQVMTVMENLLIVHMVVGLMVQEEEQLTAVQDVQEQQVKEMQVEMDVHVQLHTQQVVEVEVQVPQDKTRQQHQLEEQEVMD